MTRIRFIILAVVASLTFPFNAWAEGAISAAVLNLEGDGVDPSMVETLTSIVRNEAQQIDRYEVVNKFPVAFKDILLVLGCSEDSPTCLQQAAEQVEARVLIFGRVSRRDATYKIELNIFDAANGRMVDRLVRTLTDAEDPVISFRQEIEAFFADQHAVPLTRVQIGANVEGARVHMEDTFIGTVPLERKGLPPGTYRVEVTHPGYRPFEIVLELEQGEDAEIWAQLEAIESSEVAATEGANTQERLVLEPHASSSAHLDEHVSSTNWGAWSAIAVGGVSLGGSALLALSMKGIEKTLARERDAGTLTERRYDTLASRGKSQELAHRILLGVGLVGVTSGVVWLMLDDDDGAERARVEVGLSPTGVQAGMRW